jgi:hypothetical protein
MCLLHWLLDPNNLTAISTLLIAVFTGVLIVVGWSQARATRAVVNLARDEFNAAHRPEITIQSITANIEVVDGSERIGASILCFNKGRVMATNIVVRGRITRTLEPPPQAAFEDVPTRANTIGKGMGHQFYMRSDYSLSEQALLDSSAGQPRLWCVGVIHYHIQSGGIAGQTGFSRIWDSQRQNWQPTDKPELDWEL